MTDRDAFTVGLAAGGAWSWVNLWCLQRALRVWLSPSPRFWVAAVWIAAKLLLYGLAVVLLLRPRLSPVGFGIGFTFVVLGAILRSLRWIPGKTPSP